MPSFQHFGGSTPVFENARSSNTSYQQFTQVDQTWILTDPALTQFQYEHDLHQKYNQNVQQEAFAFQQAVANSEYLPGFQDVIDTSGLLHYHDSWNSAQDSYRSMRYDSPNGQHGGTLSASSSEFGFSPLNRTSSLVISKCSQPFAFTPTPIESCLNQQSMWHTDIEFAGSLPSPPDSTTTNTQAIALSELEFSGGINYYDGQYLQREDLIEFNTGVVMQIPEELELTESIATLTTSSRADTILTPNSIDDESEPEEVDHDSDPDFAPIQLKTARRESQLSARNLAPSSSPRRNTSIQSYPVQDSKSRIQKSTKRPTLHGNKERRKSRTYTRPAVVKSYSTGSMSKAPKYFPCTFHVFGCQAAFGNKNEWKRHVSSQHLQLGIFRCDLGECNPENVVRYNSSSEGHRRRRNNNTRQNLEEDEIEVTYNDFNRKDLFTQHCRRMHGPQRFATDSTSFTNQIICERVRRTVNNPTSKSKNTKTVVTKEDELAFERELEDIRQRCWQTRRKAPARSYCGFCNEVFETEQHFNISSKSRSSNTNNILSVSHNDADDGKAEEKAWEERMEHIGKHYERDNLKADSEQLDKALEEWGLQVGILEFRTDAEGNQKSWLIGCDDISLSSANRRNGGAIKDEEGEMIDDVEKRLPRRSGLRSSGGRSIRPKRENYDDDIVAIKSDEGDEDQKMKDESDSEDDGKSDDDASAEDE